MKAIWGVSARQTPNRLFFEALHNFFTLYNVAYCRKTSLALIYQFKILAHSIHHDVNLGMLTASPQWHITLDPVICHHRLTAYDPLRHSSRLWVISLRPEWQSRLRFAYSCPLATATLLILVIKIWLHYFKYLFNYTGIINLPSSMSSTPREIGTLIVVILRAVSSGWGCVERSIYSVIESPPKQKEYREARPFLFSHC
jgi:hypothetical protein